MDQSIVSLESILKSWEHSVLVNLPKLVLAIVVLLVFIFMAGLVKRISFSFYKRTVKVHPEIASIISSLIYFR